MARFFLVAVALTSSCGLFPSLDGLSESDGGGEDAIVAADSGDASQGKDAQADVAPPIDAGNPTYVRAITIHNNASTALPVGYTIGVAFPETELQAAISSGKMRSDLNDLRVHGSSNERDRLVDAPPMARVVWFSISSSIGATSTDTNYAITYGVPNAGAPPANGVNVFTFYDDFSGTTLDSKWISQGTINVGNGMLTLPQNGLGSLTTLAQMPTTTCEFRAQITNPSSDPQSTFYYWFGFQHQGDFDPSPPWILWIARGKDGIGAENHADGCTACDETPGTQNTSFRLYSIERQPAQTVFTLDGVSWSTPATNDQALSLMVRNWLVSGDLNMDWIRSRTRIYPEPTVTLGPEQKQ